MALIFCKPVICYLTGMLLKTSRYVFTLYHDSPFALNLQAAFWLTCAHYIIRTYSHPSTHEPALSRSTALLRRAVRSLMAQEKNMSASQPHSFLLRSLYHILYALFCFLSIYIQIFFPPSPSPVHKNFRQKILHFRKPNPSFFRF